MATTHVDTSPWAGMPKEITRTEIEVLIEYVRSDQRDADKAGEPDTAAYYEGRVEAGQAALDVLFGVERRADGTFVAHNRADEKDG